MLRGNKLSMSETAEDISSTFPRHSIMQNEKIYQSRRRSIVREFFLNTSTHGLPGIGRSKNVYSCLFWSISFLTFTAIMIYFIAQATLTYYAHPTNIDIKITNDWPQYYPAVSICNSAPLLWDKFWEPFREYLETLNLTDNIDNTTISSRQASYIWSFVIEKLNRNESILPFFYPLSSMLVSCTFNSQQCSETDFIRFTSATHGLCHTFNAKLKNSENKSVRYDHENSGQATLTLELYIHSHQAVPHARSGRRRRPPTQAALPSP